VTLSHAREARRFAERNPKGGVMSRRMLVVLGLAAILVTAAIALPKGADVPEETYRVRVTSSVPGSALKFEGAYVFSGTAPGLTLVDEVTPFEVEGKGALAAGIFQRVSGDALLVVEATTFRKGVQSEIAKATGTGVIFGDNLTEGVTKFVHTYHVPGE